MPFSFSTSGGSGTPGPQGPQGETGPAGPAGPEGPAGSNYSTYLVRNNTESVILKGTLVGAVGAEPSGRIDVAPFQTTGLQDSELRVMGIAMDNISPGVNGTVMSLGTLGGPGLDTRGTAAGGLSVGDENWAEGDILYAHPTVPGKLTKIRPKHDLAVAFITIRHQSEGQIAIRIIPGNFHLEWMHDVVVDSPLNNQVLTYDDADGVWKNLSNQGLVPFEGTWTVPAGTHTRSFTVDWNKNYVMWVRANITNGIIVWNARVTVTNENVPVVGDQYAWYDADGNNLVLNSIPNQIIGTSGNIISTTPVTTGANTFAFSITNNSGSDSTISYGYIKF